MLFTRFFFFFFFFLLPSFLLARLFFSAFPRFLFFFLPPGILLIHVYSPHTARMFCRSRSANMFVPLFSRPGWQRASERRGRSVVVGRVETWASAKVRSRPGMQPGSERARSVVESRDLDAKIQASAKIYSRPGCNEPSECENLLETWMQRASECGNLLETWMQRASECENLLETCTSRPGWIKCEGPPSALHACACQENLILP